MKCGERWYRGGRRYNLRPMGDRRLVILTAVALEARAVAAAWGARPPSRRGPTRIFLPPGNVEIHLVGIGARHLPLNLPPVRGIVMAGLAGALDPALKVGDVVIDDCPEGALPGRGYRRGKIVAADHVLTTPQHKREWFAQTGALAVDMESAAARGLAERLGTPFASIRAISDAANDALDPAILGFVDEFGRPRVLPLAGALMRRPGLVPSLRRLGAASNLAARQLGEIVRQIVANWPAEDQ